LSRSDSDRRSGGERRSGPDRRRGAPASRPAAGLDRTGDLLAAARRARLRAVAPYSRFQVCAALETVDGTVITGCNVENATYGLTMCAERVAVFKALSDGHREFVRLAIVADTARPTPPCGACRQLLWEFCGDLDVILADLSGERGRHPLRSLLPLPFDRRLLR
jgi:cytidine deaminase